MKLLLILGVVLLVVWLWRGRRHDAVGRDPAPRPPGQAARPQDMVRCALCSVHVPGADAIEGKKGWYCSAEHRQRAEP